MSEEMKKCPYCGEEILSTAKKCKHCGEWLEKDSNVNLENENNTSEYNLIIKHTKNACVFYPASFGFTIYVDNKEYKLKSGNSLQLKVDKGLHKITCEYASSLFKSKNEISVNVEDRCIVGFKNHRYSGKIKLQEGEFKQENKCCILGGQLSVSSLVLPAILAIPGIILSIIGLIQIKKTQEDGKCYGIVGLIAGLIAIVFSLLATSMGIV